MQTWKHPQNFLVKLFLSRYSLFICKKALYTQKVRYLKGVIFVSACIKLFLSLWLQSLLLSLSGDVKIKAGPRRNFDEGFSICHWNLTIMSNYLFIKPIFAFIIFTLYAFLKRILTLKTHLMMTVWRFMVKT